MLIAIPFFMKLNAYNVLQKNELDLMWSIFNTLHTYSIPLRKYQTNKIIRNKSWLNSHETVN